MSYGTNCQRGDEGRNGQSAGRPMLIVGLMAAFVALAGGCGGQSETERDGTAGGTEQREKPDFELSLLTTQPNNVDRVESHVKPGHWFSAELLAEATRADFEGRLAVGPIDLEGVPFELRAARPALLAKEQPRRLPFAFYTPVGWGEEQIAANLTGRGGDELARASQQLSYLPPHQYYFVVLAREPEDYGFLRTLPTVRAPSGSAAAEGQDDHYRVLLPRVEQQAPLPSSLMTWTSTAYVLWDDFDPELLTADQQVALTDWLHWGGQMVVSGPGTLDRLRGSFLASWLPAEGVESVEFTVEDWAALQVPGWIMEEPRGTTRSATVGVRLRPLPESQVLSTLRDWPLLVERKVGRGRVCVSAVSLDEPSLRNWTQFDAWFNACVLRRAARRFEVEPVMPELKVTWADGTSQFDARHTTRLRLFSRDTHGEWDAGGWHTTGWRGPESGVPAPEDLEAWHYDRRAQTGPGMGGWDDFGVVSTAARRSLREAAGLTIPSSSFVWRVVAMYLAVLVPANWLLFKALGRVEWAWGAVPVMSLVFTVLVARWAQLDIGFARAETELGVVEMHADYPRAHVTRYSALYTSLSTSYDALLSDAYGVALPFPDGSTLLSREARGSVTYRRDQDARLEGVYVASNSIGLVHSEQMLDVGGGIALQQASGGRWRVMNETSLELEQVGVVGPEGAAWVGRMEPGGTAALSFEAQPAGVAWEANWDKAVATSARPAKGTLSVRELMQIAVQTCPVDEFRLIGWTDDTLEGQRIEPVASQKRQAAVVVAHLRGEPEGAPMDDANRPPETAVGPTWKMKTDDEAVEDVE